VVASEPGALVHAGVAAEPDPAVVRRFITTGACDDTERTFFGRIRRVLPGEAVVLPAGGRGVQRRGTEWTRTEVGPEEAIRDATDGARLGVVVSPGQAGAAVLGAALSRPQRLRPLPVYSAVWSDIEGGAAHSPAVLVPLPHGTVRHTSHTVTPGRAELDRFLADVGEPVPDLGFYAMWTVARELSGEVDALADASTGTLAGLERVADRLLARYGVSVRCPLREAPCPPDVLTSLAGRTLPANAARHASADSAQVPTAADVVRALGDEVAAALVTARPWSDPAVGVTALRRLHAGEDVDAEPLLRAYLVERWLAAFSPTEPAPAPVVEAPPEEPAPVPDRVTVGGDSWLRLPVRTGRIAPGEPIGASVSWFVANALTDDLFAGPWFAVVSGKAVAVSQKRVDPLLDVVPGRAARTLARLARRRLPQLAEAWTMQVAIDHSGLSRLASAVLFGASLGPDGQLYPPRADALTPGDTAVIRAPFQPDDAAASLVAALRFAVPRDAMATLAGAAVVSADELGARVLGYADGPYADAVARARTLLSLILADNPAGQGGERTPIVLVGRATHVSAGRRDYATLQGRR
jgi:hypothetical protein